MKYLFLKLGLSLVLSSFVSLTFSQGKSESWSKSLMDKTQSFREIQEEFNESWRNKDYVKGKGWKQFKRWENFWENRLMPDGSFPNFSEAFSEYNEFIGQHSKSVAQNGNWFPVGPFEHETTGSWSSGTGRINVVVEDPNDSNTLYAGAPAGGIWKTTDRGESWTPIGDYFAVIGISGIAVDPNDSNVIYVTTGDADAGNTYSIGIWKSVDGGDSWFESSSGFTGQGNKILIDQENSNVIWAGSDQGLFKSTNFGETWNQLVSEAIKDIAIKPNDSQTIYAVGSAQCYYTDDGGDNFSTSNGLPNNTNRLAVSTTPANPEVVYILAANDAWGLKDVYKSSDSGVTFQAKNVTDDIFNGSTQAWYDMALSVSDTDENTLFTGVLNIWRSTDGGSTWTGINEWYSPSSPSYTHADIHYLNHSNGTLYCGSDGGVYISEDNGNTFTDLSDGLQIGQYYTIAGSQNDPSVFCGGLQDNGGYIYSNNSWKCYYGADGMGSAVNPNNSDEIWGMIQYGDLYYTTNGGYDLHGVGKPEDGQWVTPMAHDPNNSRIIAGYSNLYEYEINGDWNQLSTQDFGGQLQELEIYEGNSNIIYVSRGASLWKTTDGGMSFTEISTPGSVSSIEINPSDDTEIWISIGGWNSGEKVFHSTNSGADWENLTLNLPDLSAQIIKYNSSNSALYLGMDIGVYYYDDLLGDWIPFNTNLPNVIVNDLEINEDTGIIRAGTYGRGVWESNLYHSEQFDTDAMIVSINSPSETICGETINPEITVRNMGIQAINSLSIEYNIDGAPSSTFIWEGSLSTGQNETISLPELNSPDGEHMFNVSLSNPNGINDQNIENNSSEVTFSSISNGTSSTFTLETDCWGQEVSWQLTNELDEVLFSVQQGSLNSESITEWDFCLQTGCYELKINDEYGDGMNGTNFGCGIDGDYYLTDSEGAILVQMADPNYGSEITETFCLGNSGCIDSEACNYDETATIDNNSCTYPDLWYYDGDSDGFGDSNVSIEDCEEPNGYVSNNLDCDDNDSEIHGGSEEVCDGLDNNCDGTIDEGFDQITWWQDEDNDGFGNFEISIQSCQQPEGFVANSEDCDDNDEQVNPDSEEVIADGIDQDCDGEDQITNLSELEISEFSIFPNPATDEFRIDFKQPISGEVKLFDVTGKLVYSVTLVNQEVQEFSTLSLSKGAYSIKVIVEGHSTAKKLLIE